MVLTEKQAHLLLVVLQDSIKHNVVCLFSLSIEDRGRLLDGTLNQQPDKLVNVLCEFSRADDGTR